MIPALAPSRSGSESTTTTTWFVDLVALAITLMMLAVLIVPGDGDLPGRPALALVAITFVPGWTVLRLVKAPINVLTVLGAVALSVSLAMLASLVTVAWLGWHWHALAVLWMLVTSLVLAAVIARPSRLVDTIANDIAGESVDSVALDDRWALTRPRWRSDSDVGADVDASNDMLRWILTVAGLLVCGIAIAVANPADIDGYGLISAVPRWFFLGVALLLTALFLQLRAGDRTGRIGAAVNLGCLIVVLHGMPGLVEPEPRFPVAWLHAGFADQIAYDGKLLPLLDARFSWAGFFSGAAFVERVAGTPNLLWILRFTPIVVNGAAALAVYALARGLNTSSSRSITAATIFVFTNWIGQDYFAPQAVGFVLVFVCIAAVLTYFSDSPKSGGRVARWVGSAGSSPAAITGNGAAFVYLAVLFVAAGIIASHQLSPPMLIAMLVALSLVGRVRPKLLGPIVGLGFVLWISHAAESYWVGHLSDLFGQVGHVTTVINSNVSRRAEPGSPAREFVVRGRIVIMLAVWSAAGVAMLGQRRRRSLDPALAALFAAPFVVLAVQSYGGEVLLRVALFTLPAASILIARMELPLRVADGIRAPRIAVPIVALSLLAPVFLLARFGNESYEQVTPDDRAVVDDMYRLVPDGSRVYVINRSTVMYADRLMTVRFRDLSSDPLTAEQMLDDADDGEAPIYVLLTHGEAGYRHEVQGALPNWMDEFASQLLASGRVRVVSQHGDSMLLEHLGRA